MILGLDELFAALLYKEIAVNNPVPKVTFIDFISLFFLFHWDGSFISSLRNPPVVAPLLSVSAYSVLSATIPVLTQQPILLLFLPTR